MGGTIIHTQVQFSDRRPLKDVQNILYCTRSPSNYALCYVSCIMAIYWYECHSQCSILFCPTELQFSVVKLTHWSVSVCPSGSDTGHTGTDCRVSCFLPPFVKRFSAKVSKFALLCTRVIKQEVFTQPLPILFGTHVH